MNVNDAFGRIAESFFAHRTSHLYVTDAEQCFRGVIALHDIKSYLSNAELAGLVIARDIMDEKFPAISPDASLEEALDRLSRHDGERLPVTEDGGMGKLIGSISKTDLILALAERAKE